MRVALMGHGAGGGADEIFLLAAAGLLLAGLVRLLDTKLPTRKRLLGAAAVALAAGLGAAPVVFRFGGLRQAKVRPSTTASVVIVAPTAGSVVRVDTMDVIVRLEGARIAPPGERLRPDRGHVHLWIDGAAVGSTGGLRDRIPVGGLAAGRHILQAELVASDHGSFSPKVLAVLEFHIP